MWWLRSPRSHPIMVKPVGTSTYQLLDTALSCIHELKKNSSQDRKTSKFGCFWWISSMLKFLSTALSCIQELKNSVTTGKMIIIDNKLKFGGFWSNPITLDNKLIYYRQQTKIWRFLKNKIYVVLSHAFMNKQKIQSRWISSTWCSLVNSRIEKNSIHDQNLVFFVK